MHAFDLFPEKFEVPGLTCTRADLTKELPIASESVDFVVCQEGIEHLPDQLHVLSEFSRILRPGGRLLLTTPSVSHVRARVSHLLLESDLYRRLPANEIEEVWHAEDGRTYHGHIFLINAQKLRTLARLAGLRIAQICPTKVSYSSLILGVLLYPLIAFVTWRARARSERKAGASLTPEMREAFAGMARLNLHPDILFGKHLFFEFEKSGVPGHTQVTKDQEVIW
ncbi:MAG: hypothetical protein Kow0074_20390 [Candidatus Zixiibacteriota bacterium]